MYLKKTAAGAPSIETFGTAGGGLRYWVLRHTKHLKNFLKILQS
jgi:hypothetical protein